MSAVEKPTTTKPADILLVEDSPSDVRLTQEALREAKVRGHLHVVSDGVEALDFLRHRGRHAAAPHPDLILLDLNLPRLNGREVLAEIKGDPELRRIPTVVLSTSCAEEDVSNAYDLHANCYVSKPLDMDAFVDAIRAIDGFWLSMVTRPGEGI